MFSPDEKVVLSDKGSIRQPVQGRGEIYLTDKRLFLAHKSGLVKKRDTLLLDVEIGQMTYAKVEGTLRKVLVVGVRGTAGMVLAYKIHVSDPDAWVSQIYDIKGGGGHRPASPQPVQATQLPRAEASGSAISGAKFCRHCGKQIAPDSMYCSNCGRQQ